MRTRTSVGWIAMIFALGVLTVTLTTGLFYISGKNTSNRLEIENRMQESLVLANESIGTMESNLSKLMISTDKDESAALLFDTSFQAKNAIRSLDALPVDHEDRLKVEKYLNQVADFCLAYAKNPKDSYGQTCEQLYSTAVKLKENISDASSRLDGNYKVLENLDKGLNLKLDLSAVTNSEQQTYRLIYDGPFSDSASKSFRAIDKLETVDLETAVKEAEKTFGFLGLRSVEQLGEASSPQAYVLDGKTSAGRISLNVSKNGGKIICASVYESDISGDITVSEEDAIKLALNYADSCGYKDLSAVWYIEADSVATVSLAPQTDGVICYPDMVKVKLDLRGGEFLGIEAMGYCSCNHVRQTLKPAISKEQALKSVSEKLTVTSTRLAMIPHNQDEKLCYEVSGSYKGLDYFVYIDAQTGKQADIMRVIDSKQGKMVI